MGLYLTLVIEIPKNKSCFQKFHACLTESSRTHELTDKTLDDLQVGNIEETPMKYIRFFFVF